MNLLENIAADDSCEWMKMMTYQIIAAAQIEDTQIQQQ